LRGTVSSRIRLGFADFVAEATPIIATFDFPPR